MLTLTAHAWFVDPDHDYTQVRVRSSRCTYYVDITSTEIFIKGPGVSKQMERYEPSHAQRIDDPEALALTLIALWETGEL